jgi:hypothetical protein
MRKVNAVVERGGIAKPLAVDSVYGSLHDVLEQGPEVLAAQFEIFPHHYSVHQCLKLDGIAVGSCPAPRPEAYPDGYTAFR